MSQLLQQNLHFPTFQLIMRTVISAAFTRLLDAAPTNHHLVLFRRQWLTDQLEDWFNIAIRTAWNASPIAACSSAPELVPSANRDYPWAIKMVQSPLPAEPGMFERTAWYQSGSLRHSTDIESTFSVATTIIPIAEPASMRRYELERREPEGERYRGSAVDVDDHLERQWRLYGQEVLEDENLQREYDREEYE